jgi:hypothetical protein
MMDVGPRGFCGTGVPPAVSESVPRRKIADGTPAPQKPCAPRIAFRNEKEEIIVEIHQEGRDV